MNNAGYPPARPVSPFASPTIILAGTGTYSGRQPAATTACNIKSLNLDKNNYMWELIRKNNLFNWKGIKCNNCIIKA
jgi:hypothetical protein